MAKLGWAAAPPGCHVGAHGPQTHPLRSSVPCLSGFLMLLHL